MFQHKLYQLYAARLPLADGDDSDSDEEVDSNNDGGSLQSERADKDEEACEGTSHRPLSRRPKVDSLTANKLWI